MIAWNSGAAVRVTVALLRPQSTNKLNETKQNRPAMQRRELNRITTSLAFQILAYTSLGGFASVEVR